MILTFISISQCDLVHSDEIEQEILPYSFVSNAHHSNSIQEFNEWIASFGLKTFLQIVDMLNSDGKKTVAIEDIKSGSIILEIPSDMLMSTSTALQSSIGYVFQDSSYGAQAPSSTLAIHILYEKYNSSSVWKPYLNMLPESIDNTILWSKEELKYLQGSWLYDRTIEDNDGLEAEYTSIFPSLFQKFPHIFQPEQYSLLDFKWAFAVIWSRSFVFPVNGQKKTHMVPMADMLNHKGTAKTHFTYDNDKNKFIMYVNDSYSTGSEVFNNYDPRPNNNLLQLYGFVEQDNRQNDVKLNIQLKKDKYIKFKQQFLEQWNLWDHPYPYSNILRIGDSNTISSTLLAFLRVKHFSSPVPMAEFKQQLLGMNPFTEVSKENERNALIDLLDVCQKTLNNYPTTIRKDEDVMKPEHYESQRHKMAIQVQLEEKMILSKVIRTLNAMLKNINSNMQ